MQPSPVTPIGIKPSRLVLPNDKQFIGRSLLDFLVQHFSHIPPHTWQARFEEGLITNEAGESLALDTPYQVGQTVLYYRHVDNEPIIPFEPTILHLDEHLLVVDKPHFLPVTPTGQYVSQTVLAKLRIHADLQHLMVNDISPIHRLDKDTAGVMLLSVNPATRTHYQSLFEKKVVKKTYHAIAPTRTDLAYPYKIASKLGRGEPFFLTQTLEGEPNSFTTIELLQPLTQYGGEFSLYRLTPLTGKKHQLRVHMASLGMPLLNDNFYPVVKNQGITNFANPLKLLAQSIEFIDPITGKNRLFHSGLSLF
ncbi:MULTISPECIES: pseudouridine synthase [unclassified Moraxella]|uniref:pseudouridine synthase n=1 Tax=unclassified Moraxella TaxID=2685852 RepID=UPI003AF9E7FB